MTNPLKIDGKEAPDDGASTNARSRLYPELHRDTDEDPKDATAVVPPTDAVREVATTSVKDQAIADIVNERKNNEQLPEEPAENERLLEVELGEPFETNHPYVLDRDPAAENAGLLPKAKLTDGPDTTEEVQKRLRDERTQLELSLTKDHETPDGTPDLSIIVSAGEDSQNNVRWWLYLAEVFGRWGDRMWSFTAALFLLELFPGTLLMPAIHGFVTGISVILSGALIGEWVDRTPRLQAIRTALIIQNSAVALGSFILTFALFHRDALSTEGKILCVVGFLLFAVVGDCGSVAMNIIVEKDWVVVIARGNKNELANMNATIRRIDLTCQILSPIIIAQIMTFSEHYVGTIVVCLWNLFSMAVEYFVLLKIYNNVPMLAVKPLVPADKNQERPLSRKIFRSCFAISDGWQTYFKNRVASAGIGLACLYLTVLSFAGVTNTYVRTQGLSESVISIMMALGAVTGITGTFVFPILRQKVGLERTGLFALAAQISCLALCVIAIWLPGSPFDPTFSGDVGNATALEDSKAWITRPVEELPSVIVFMCGMIGARFGLWMADLTITQLLQENVAEKERGVVGGVQNGMNRFMDMLKFILVICLPYPSTFGILIIISFLSVLTGDCFYAYYSYKTRGHVLPHFGPPRINQNLQEGSLHDPHSIVVHHREIVSGARA